jgi:hypothetical protein
LGGEAKVMRLPSITDPRQRRILARIVVAECDPQPVEPTAFGGEIVDVKEDRASGGDLFAAGEHQPTFIGQLPLQQRGHRPVIRPAAEQPRVPAFGRVEIGGEQGRVGLLDVHALLRVAHARSIRQCGVDGVRRGRIA